MIIVFVQGESDPATRILHDQRVSNPIGRHHLGTDFETGISLEWVYLVVVVMMMMIVVVWGGKMRGSPCRDIKESSYHGRWNGFDIPNLSAQQSATEEAPSGERNLTLRGISGRGEL